MCINVPDFASCRKVVTLKKCDWSVTSVIMMTPGTTPTRCQIVPTLLSCCWVMFVSLFGSVWQQQVSQGFLCLRYLSLCAREVVRDDCQRAKCQQSVS